MLSPHAVDTIKDAIEKFDQSAGGISALKVFLRQINEATSSAYDPFITMWGDFPEPVRYKMTAISLTNLGIDADNFNRIEMRSVRAQMDVYVWIRQIRLIRNRIRYLETLDEPIPYNPSFELSHIRALATELTELEHYKLNPPAEAQEALKAFQKFVEESGENIHDHLDYVWPEWITNGEVEKFKKGLCNNLLEEGA